MAEGDNNKKFGNVDPSAAAKQAAEAANALNEVNLALSSLTSKYAANIKGTRDIVKSTESSFTNIAKELTKTTEQQRNQQKIQSEVKNLNQQLLRIDVERAILMEKVKNASGAYKDDIIVALEGLLATEETIKSSATGMGEIADQAQRIVDAGEGFEKMAKILGSIPLIGNQIAPAFERAAGAARSATEDAASPFQAKMAGTLALSKQIALTIGTAIVGALIAGSKRAGDLNKQLGLGIDSARGVAERFEQFATASEDSRITTEKLIAANGQLNQALGTTVEFSGETLENFILTTEYMGVSVEAAAKLETLARTTGQSTKDFAGNLAESVSQAGKNNSLFISTGTALEKVKNLSATTLLNLRRNPEAIGEAIVATEKLGISFDQLRGIASSLLDFEGSIQKELEAEVLTGKELNLERARSAALRGDDLALAKELASQVGTLAEFEGMNVIQRESMAQAFGLSSDAMSEMLLKQELLNSLGEEARDLTAEQASEIRRMVEDGEAESEQDALLKLQQQQDIAKRFQDAVGKLKSAFVDFFEDFEPTFNKLVNAITGLSESKFLKTIIGFATSGVGIASLAGMMLASKLRGATPMTPMFVSMAGAPGAAGAGMMGFAPMGAGAGGRFYNSGTVTAKSGQVYAANSPQGKMIQNIGGQKPVGRGLTAGGAAGLAGIGMLAGGLMQQSDNEGMQIAGSALSGAGMGAMMGSMIFPGVGTAIGAAVGGLGSLLMAHHKKQEEREAKAEKAREEAKASETDTYTMMEEHLRALAEKELKLNVDGNEMGTQLQISKNALGNS